MRKNLLLAGGTALLSSALLLVAATGFVATTLLAYLTPLPLLILGLSHKKDCVGTAGGMASLVLFFLATPVVAIVYFVLVAGPVTLLCQRVTQVNHQKEDQVINSHQTSSLSGHLSALLAVIPCFILTAVFIYCWLYQEQSVGTLLTEKADVVIDNYRHALLQKNLDIKPEVGAQLLLLKDTLLSTVPAVMGVFWMTLLIINGILARYTLSRMAIITLSPVKLSQIELPQWLIIIFIVSSLIAGLLSGDISLYCLNLSVIIAFPILLSGLGVVHIASERTKYKRGILFAVYTAVFMSRWATFILVLIGLLDHFVKIKARISKPSG
jgi:hypothetical protein